MRAFNYLLLVPSLFLTGLEARADSDSSAMSAVALTSSVQGSAAVMIRVPVDEQGRELAIASELRVIQQETSNSSAGLQNQWNTGLDVSTAPVVDSSTDADSSTRWGWNSWHPYSGNWYNPYYYNNYRPTYYYGGYNYNYGYPTYGNFYQPFMYNGYYPAWGYRYYYYPRHW